MAIPSLVLALLLFLQGCLLLVCANIDPGQLPNALVYIQAYSTSTSGPPVYVGLDCSTSQVGLYSSSSGPDPNFSKFKFLLALAGTSGLDYNIQSVTCPTQYLRLDATGGSATGIYEGGFGQGASGSTTVDASATFRPLPQLAGNGYYSLQSDAVGYAYLRLDVSGGVVNAQVGIGPFERLIIDVFP